MVKSCSDKCLKFAIVVFNSLFFLLGAALLIVSVLGYVKNPLQDRLDHFIAIGQSIESLRAVLVIGMILGVAVLVMGFLGCVGAWCENRCLLGMFAILLGLLAAAQIAAVAYFMIEKGALRDTIFGAFKRAEHEAETSGADTACSLFYDLSNEAKWCCFNDGRYHAKCRAEIEDFVSCDPSTVGKGCSTVIMSLIDKYSTGIIIVVLAIAAFEILALIFACCLCCAVKRESHSF